VKWLTDHGVQFRYGVEVTDVDFDIQPGRKQATRIHWKERASKAASISAPTISSSSPSAR
jgi:oleate hydratase